MVMEVLTPYIGNYGIQMGKQIYTLTSKLQSKDWVIFDLVNIIRTPTWVEITRTLHKDNFRISRVPCPPRYSVTYLTPEGTQPFPYEEFTECQLSYGIFILNKKEKKGLGFKVTEVHRSRHWPPKVNNTLFWDM